MRRLIMRKSYEAKQEGAVITPQRFAFLRRARSYKYAGAMMAVIGAGASWYQSDALTHAFYKATATQGIALQSLHITGRNYTDKNLIIDAIGADKGSPLLALDIQNIKASLTQLGWVKSATVTRQFPDVLAINITERQPLALLQTTGGHRLIDFDGHIIFSADATQFTHLPVVAGDGAAYAAGPILEALKTEPELFADVWAVHRISDRRWDVFLRSGLEVRLPEKDAVLAWSKLAVLDRDTQIMKRDLSMIDLRVPGQLIVQPNLPLGKKGRKT